MNLGEYTATLLVNARNGDPVALQQLRKYLGPDPSQANPHYFAVTSNRLLLDTLKTGPLVRQEVFARISSFTNSDPKLSRYWTPQFAIASIRCCPPLQRVFNAEALSAMGLLEARLVTDDSLTRKGRLAIHRQIKTMLNENEPYWVNWIRSIPPQIHHKFDALVNQWLRQAIDWDESEWFDPAWKNRLWDMESAATFFKRMDCEIHWFFGIELLPAQDPNSERKLEGAFLKKSVDEVNQWAELLGVNFRFRHQASAEPAPRNRRRRTAG